MLQPLARCRLLSYVVQIICMLLDKMCLSENKNIIIACKNSTVCFPYLQKMLAKDNCVIKDMLFKFVLVPPINKTNKLVFIVWMLFLMKLPLQQFYQNNTGWLPIKLTEPVSRCEFPDSIADDSSQYTGEGNVRKFFLHSVTTHFINPVTSITGCCKCTVKWLSF